MTLFRFLPVVSALLASGCITWSGGLSPTYPDNNESLDTLTPTFAWEAADIEGAERITYSLLVLYDNDAVAYKADRITGTRHKVRTPLLPGRHYQWTVRPVYRKNGRWFAGEWSRRKYFWFALIVFGWGSDLYAFGTPRGTR